MSRPFPLRLGGLLTVLLLTVGLLLVGPTPAAEASSRPTSVTLTPTADPAHSQTFTWRMTKKRSGQQVQVKAPNGSVNTVAATYKMRVKKKYAGINSYAFTATATDLTPGTRYSYRIVTSGGSTSWAAFTTARVGLDRSWTFLAFGDTQVANTGVPEDIIDTAVSKNPAAPLLLHAGDVVNKPNSITQWRQFMAATYPTRTTKNWLISIGNHEQCVLLTKCSSGDGHAFRSYYTWPRNGVANQSVTTYYTDYQGVRFIVLDTFGGDLDQQAAFLAAALKSNTQRWTVVLQHAGPFASRSDRNNSSVRKALLPIYNKYKVDLVLSGHDHSYDRGYYGKSKNSTVYAVSVSGKKFYDASTKDWTRGGATRVAGAAHTATYQTVTVSDNTLTYRAIVGYKGKGSTTTKKVGQVLDQVTITKNGTTKTVR
ncbi:MAG: metallophosphoesterase family protein [Microlunatus sp.]